MPSQTVRTAPAGEPASSRNNGQGSRRGTKRKEDPALQPRRSRQFSKVNEDEENRDPEVFPEKARKEEEAQSYGNVESHNITEILVVSIKVGKAIDSVSHQFLHGGQALAKLGKTLDQF